MFPLGLGFRTALPPYWLPNFWLLKQVRESWAQIYLSWFWDSSPTQTVTFFKSKLDIHSEGSKEQLLLRTEEGDSDEAHWASVGANISWWLKMFFSERSPFVTLLNSKWGAHCSSSKSFSPTLDWGCLFYSCGSSHEMWRDKLKFVGHWVTL